jgi:DNA polymerase-1
MRTTRDAVNLFHRGTQTMARVEDVGVCVDVAYLYRRQEELANEIRQGAERLKEDSAVWGPWKKLYGEGAKLGSPQQLESVIFGALGYPRSGRKTDKGGDAADSAAFEHVDLPFVKEYFRLKKLEKARGTYLQNLLEEQIGGVIHPNINLHFARTYRSSCDSPNLQNQPRRDKLISEIVRTAFVPRPGHVFLEVDFAAIEVRWAANFSKDKLLIKYIVDNHDMHLDKGKRLYLLTEGGKKELKDVRDCAKNLFTFPQFYGSWWRQCAHNLWVAIDERGLKTAAGVPLKEHLRTKGITCLGDSARGGTPLPNSFEYHVRNEERYFWDTQFTGYRDRKNSWFSEYEKTGEFRMLTGFRCRGVYSRNQLLNYPVQGPAFHYLLESLIRLEAWLRQYHMKSKVVLQIHDSVLIDTHKSEVKTVLRRALEIMEDEVARDWADICIVPMEVEPEICEVNWYEKVALDRRAVA